MNRKREQSDSLLSQAFEVQEHSDDEEEYFKLKSELVQGEGSHSVLNPSSNLEDLTSDKIFAFDTQPN